MKYPTRTELVKELAKPGEDIVAAMTPHKAHMLHMAVGLMDEASELLGATSRTNVLEELGDAGFYFEGTLQGLPSELPNATIGKVDGNAHYAMNALVVAAGEVLGDIKRYAIQNKELNLVKLTQDLCVVRTHLDTIANAYGFTDDEIHTANYLKLKGGAKARYADGYSDAAAAARVDKQ